MPLYDASCHCKLVRFRFTSEPITSGIRCNCSICIRRGTVMSRYYPADAFVALEGEVTKYLFGDHDVVHCFCPKCGIAPYTVIAKVPADYAGPAKPGDRRVNLGCVHDLDAYALEIRLVDGRSL